MDLSAFLEWWNFIFVLPLVAGLVIAMGLALAGFAAAGELEGSGDADSSSAPQVLAWFGLTRGVPLAILLPLLFAVWGLSGLLLNSFLSPLLRSPLLFAPLSITASLVITSYAGRGVAAGMRHLVGGKPGAIGSGGLVGCIGRAVYRITPSGGVANVRDPHGNIHRIFCRLYEGEPALPAGKSVLVIEYQSEEKVYFVQPWEG